MRKMINKIMVAAMTAVMALSVPAAAMADDAHFTFTNTNEDQPDLYVYKTVDSALDGYTVPDAEFTFTLRWDQDGDGYLEAAGSVSYFVYDENGTQVMNLGTSDGSFKTDSRGRFTLKAGQYARFEWAGQVEYEITESAAEDFTQTKPAGGASASGTVPAEGAMVTFGNTYIPTYTGGGEPEYTQLAIRKDISWVDGYDMPDDVSAEFTFEVKIDGEPYANEPYGIYDSGLNTRLGSGTTGSDGQLTLQGGQAALFDEVEVGVDYEITELDDAAGWQAVGNTFYGGSTTSPIVYTYFANEATNLIVGKERSDGATGLDDEFTFTLTDADGSPIAGSAYYVYDMDGNLLSGELYTAEDGGFALKAGEQALFIGIAEGTGYKVAEDLAQANGYEIDGEGSLGGTVGFDSTDADIFVNAQLTDITIKKMDNSIRSKTLEGAEFTLYGQDGDGKYTVEVETLKTGEDGTLTFTGLKSGSYMIVETKAPEGYQAYGDPIYVTIPYAMTESEITDSHIDTGSADFTGIYSSRDGVYYFYDLTYDVYNNMALLEMPNTGGNAWLYIMLVAMGGVIVVAAAYIFGRGGTSRRKETA